MFAAPSSSSAAAAAAAARLAHPSSRAAGGHAGSTAANARVPSAKQQQRQQQQQHGQKTARVTPAFVRSLMPAVKDEEDECFRWNRRKCYEAIEIEARNKRWEATYAVPDTDTYDVPVLDAVYQRLVRWLRDERFHVRVDSTHPRAFAVSWDPAHTAASITPEERKNAQSNAMIRMRTVQRAARTPCARSNFYENVGDVDYDDVDYDDVDVDASVYAAPYVHHGLFSPMVAAETAVQQQAVPAAHFVPVTPLHQQYTAARAPWPISAAAAAATPTPQSGGSGVLPMMSGVEPWLVDQWLQSAQVMASQQQHPQWFAPGDGHIGARALDVRSSRATRAARVAGVATLADAVRSMRPVDGAGGTDSTATATTTTAAVFDGGNFNVDDDKYENDNGDDDDDHDNGEIAVENNARVYVGIGEGDNVQPSSFPPMRATPPAAHDGETAHKANNDNDDDDDDDDNDCQRGEISAQFSAVAVAERGERATSPFAKERMQP